LAKLDGFGREIRKLPVNFPVILQRRIFTFTFSVVLAALEPAKPKNRASFPRV
jgi:hypothetical protein